MASGLVVDIVIPLGLMFSMMARRAARDRADELAPVQVQRVDVDRLVAVLVGGDDVLDLGALEQEEQSEQLVWRGGLARGGELRRHAQQVRDIERFEREAADLDR